MAHACCIPLAPAVDLHCLDLKPRDVHLTKPKAPVSSRAASPATMSGYYSHPDDEIYSTEGSGPPVFLEDVDAFAAPGYGQTPFTAQGSEAWTETAHPSDAFGINFPTSYEPNFPMDPQMSYQTQPATFHDPSIGGSAYPMHYDAPSFNQVPSDVEFLGPYPAPAMSPHQSSANMSPNLSHMSSFSNLTPSHSGLPSTVHSSYRGGSPPLSTRSTSPNSVTGLEEYGIPQPNGTWKCAFPGCKSSVTFARPCDLRKHYHRHEKRWYCRWEGCERSEAGAATARSLAGSRRSSAADPSSSLSPPIGGFVQGVGYGTRKDRDRHERTHNPGIACPAEGCERRFARADNMRDHFRRIHASSEDKAKAKGKARSPGASPRGRSSKASSSSGSGAPTRRR